VTGAAPITGLSHVQLLVGDVARSAAWYTTVLGLEPYAADEALGFVALRHRASGVVVVLTPHGDRAADGSPCVAVGGARLDHLAFAVPDGPALEEWAGRLTRLGVLHDGVVPENGNPSLQLRDPDGLAIELVAPGPRPGRAGADSS
jgi:glyoxylase I family protein